MAFIRHMSHQQSPASIAILRLPNSCPFFSTTLHRFPPTSLFLAAIGTGIITFPVFVMFGIIIMSACTTHLPPSVLVLLFVPRRIHYFTHRSINHSIQYSINQAMFSCLSSSVGMRAQPISPLSLSCLFHDLYTDISTILTIYVPNVPYIRLFYHVYLIVMSTWTTRLPHLVLLCPELSSPHNSSLFSSYIVFPLCAGPFAFVIQTIVPASPYSLFCLTQQPIQSNPHHIIPRSHSDSQ